MSKQDEYRAKAEYCDEMAANVMGPADKAEWLQLATNWRTLESLSDREHREAAAYQKQMQDMDEIWARLASQLSKGDDER